MFRLCDKGNGRWLYLWGIVAVNSLLFQSILVSVGNAPWSSSLQEYHKPRNGFMSFPSLHSATEFSAIRDPLTVGGSNSTKYSAFSGIMKNVHSSIVSDETHHPKWLDGMKNDIQSSTDAFEFGADRNNVHSFPEEKVDDKNESSDFDGVGIKNKVMPILIRKSEYDLSAKQILKKKSRVSTNYP